MKVHVIVKPKPEVLDPQGEAILRSLRKMGHEQLVSVRQGKFFELEFAREDQDGVRTTTEQIAQAILSNPLIEAFEIEEPE